MWHQRKEIVSIASSMTTWVCAFTLVRNRNLVRWLPLNCVMEMPHNKSGRRRRQTIVHENEIIGQFQFVSRILLSGLSEANHTHMYIENVLYVAYLYTFHIINTKCLDHGHSSNARHCAVVNVKSKYIYRNYKHAYKCPIQFNTFKHR